MIQKEEERGFRTGDEAAINGHVPANASSSANTITSHSIKKSPSKTDQKYNLSKDSTVTYTASPNVNRYSGFDLKSSPSNSEDSEEEDDDDFKPKVNTPIRKSFPARSRFEDSDDSMDSSPSPKPVRKSSGYPDKKQSPPGKVKKSASRLSGENGFTPLSDLARKDKSSKTKTSRVNVNININVESTVKNSGSRTSNSMRERDTPPSTTHLEIPNIHRRKLLNEKQRHRSRYRYILIMRKNIKPYLFFLRVFNLIYVLHVTENLLVELYHYLNNAQAFYRHQPDAEFL